MWPRTKSVAAPIPTPSRGSEADHGPDTDYRFSLANERTYLAWVRTALALLAGGVAAAKALDFHHDWVRWLIATPPILAAALLALEARSRWRIYESAMAEPRCGR
jgi:putative membrane protein